MNFQKKRVQLLLFVAAIVLLSITDAAAFPSLNSDAEKCRQLVGEEASSQSGKFTLLNCFDGSSGTLACTVKEGVKLYFYNIRAAHVERVRHQTIEKALVDALTQGLTAPDAAKQAQKEAAKAAKLASQKAKRIIGPIISSGWDFFEALYYGGTVTEGFLRGTGTLFGAYAVGFLGEQRFGRFGYLVGSHLGSWGGGRIGLMVYDVVNGVHSLLQFVQPEETKVHETSAFESSEGSQDSNLHETASEDSNVKETSEDSNVHETSEDSNFYETSEDSNFYETSEDPNIYESPVYERSEGHEEF